MFELTNRHCCYCCRSYGIDWEEKLESLSSSSQREGDEGQSFWSTEVPNLQDPLVEVHVHKGSKRKAKVPAKQGGVRMSKG